jgi:hypothetical protein
LASISDANALQLLQPLTLAHYATRLKSASDISWRAAV